jgi:cephalosporin-C deacetylase-like acetyl esterase
MGMSMGEYYPSRSEVDAWAEEIWHAAAGAPVAAEVLDEAGLGMNPWFYPGSQLWKSRFVRLAPAGEEPFYVYWQPVAIGPAPLCAHLPGSGCEMTSRPAVVSEGFNVLEISPLGLGGPYGVDAARACGPESAMFPLSILSQGRDGYFHWLRQSAMAVRWAWGQPEVLPGRVSFFGASQGGGGSLLLGSVFLNRGVRCIVAEQPFLTDFRGGTDREAGRAAFEKVRERHGESAAWRGLGLIDTLSHAHRLTVPVLLGAGTADAAVPCRTAEALFGLLPSTRAYCLLDGRGHTYSPEFQQLAIAWFRAYA